MKLFIALGVLFLLVALINLRHAGAILDSYEQRLADLERTEYACWFEPIKGSAISHCE